MVERDLKSSREDVIIRVEFGAAYDDSTFIPIVRRVRESLFGSEEVKSGHRMEFPDLGRYFDIVVTDPGAFWDVNCAVLDLNACFVGIRAKIVNAAGIEIDPTAGQEFSDSNRRTMQLNEEGVTEEGLRTVLGEGTNDYEEPFK